MPRHRFRAIRESLGLTVAQLADWLDCDDRSVRRYEAGHRRIPGPVAALMGAFAVGYRPTGC